MAQNHPESLRSYLLLSTLALLRFAFTKYRTISCLVLLSAVSNYPQL